MIRNAHYIRCFGSKKKKTRALVELSIIYAPMYTLKKHSKRKKVDKTRQAHQLFFLAPPGFSVRRVAPLVNYASLHLYPLFYYNQELINSYYNSNRISLSPKIH